MNIIDLNYRQQLENDVEKKWIGISNSASSDVNSIGVVRMPDNDK